MVTAGHRCWYLENYGARDWPITIAAKNWNLLSLVDEKNVARSSCSRLFIVSTSVHACPFEFHGVRVILRGRIGISKVTRSSRLSSNGYEKKSSGRKGKSDAFVCVSVRGTSGLAVGTSCISLEYCIGVPVYPGRGHALVRIVHLDRTGYLDGTGARSYLGNGSGKKPASLSSKPRHRAFERQPLPVSRLRQRSIGFRERDGAPSSRENADTFTVRLRLHWKRFRASCPIANSPDPWLHRVRPEETHDSEILRRIKLQRHSSETTTVAVRSIGEFEKSCCFFPRLDPRLRFFGKSRLEGILPRCRQ